MNSGASGQLSALVSESFGGAVREPFGGGVREPFGALGVPRDALSGPAGWAVRVVEVLAAASVDAVDPAGLVAELAAWEGAKAAIAARQAELAVLLDRVVRAEQEAVGVPAGRRGLGVPEQVALARRESPSRGSRLLGLAKALQSELPGTRELLRAGRISEWRATIVAAETACLERDLRLAVDAEIAPQLAGLSDRAVRAAARAAAYRLDPCSVLAAGRRAAGERCVSLRPAPETMTYLTALLPVREGVSCLVALQAAADAARAGGDVRGRGQVMADTLVTRLTGLADADAVQMEIQLVMSDRALLPAAAERAAGQAPRLRRPREGAGDGAQASRPREGAGHGAQPSRPRQQAGEGAHDQPQQEAAYVVGYGPVPAPLARAWARESTASVFLRRLYVDPRTGQLTRLESRRRLFPAALRRAIIARDRYCRTPWCGAPIRHADHVTAHAAGGATDLANGQGLCERCNQAKEAPGWAATTIPDPAGLGRHVVRTTTPTGHHYHSTAPPVMGTSAPPVVGTGAPPVMGTGAPPVVGTGAPPVEGTSASTAVSPCAGISQEDASVLSGAG